MSGKDELPPWMEMLISQDLMEEQDQMVTPTQLLDENGRSFIWWLCRKFSLSSDRVMGQSCTLLERFIAKQLQVYSYVQRYSSEWDQVTEELGERVPLLASACIALTSKMLSSERPLLTKHIHQTLTQLEYNYTKSQINTAKIDVLSKLDFHIPMFTNVEKAVTIATHVGMTGLFLDAVSLVTEVAEYYRRSIQQEIKEIACSFLSDKKIHPDEIANIRHIHLVAGCVMATAMFLKFTGPNPMAQLCFLTQCSKAYLKCIGDVIHRRLMKECVLLHSKENQRPTKQPNWDQEIGQPSTQPLGTWELATQKPLPLQAMIRQLSSRTTSPRQPAILRTKSRKRKLQE